MPLMFYCSNILHRINIATALFQGGGTLIVGVLQSVSLVKVVKLKNLDLQLALKIIFDWT